MNADLKELLASCETYINSSTGMALGYDQHRLNWVRFLEKVNEIRAKYKTPEVLINNLSEEVKHTKSALIALERRVDELCYKMTPDP